MSEWIPMTEREPEPYTTVLITIRTRYDNTWEYYTDVADYYEYGWSIFNDWDEGQGYDIIAWMPLPQPWKEQTNET